MIDFPEGNQEDRHYLCYRICFKDICFAGVVGIKYVRSCIIIVP